MTRNAALDLRPEDQRLVLKILHANLPLAFKAWVFGSRATGRARRYSDLDLAIDCGRPLTLDETAGLREAFTESDLPYKVDFVDWRSIDDRFRELIAAERIPLVREASVAGSGDPGGHLTEIRRRIGRLQGPSTLEDLRRDRHRDER